MNYLKQLSFTNLIIFISFLLTTILTTAWFFEMSLTSNKVIENFKELHIKQKKELVKKEVENAVNYINYKKENTEEKLKKQIKNKIYEAHNIISNIYNKFKDTKSKEEILSIIKESLRQIRFFDGRGYYFVMHIDGTAILHPIFPKLEGDDRLKNFKDLKGTYIHNEFVKIAKSKSSEGFIEYYFYRTDKKDTEDKKIGFIKYFEPYDIFIGSAEYVKDYEQILKKEVINRLREIKFGNNGYIYVTNLNGDVILNSQYPNIEGQNYMNYKDAKGVFVVKEMIKASSKKAGDFIYYSWAKPNTKETKDKFSYVIKDEDWNWMVAGGEYIDDINNEVLFDLLSKKDEQKNRIYLIGLVVIFLLLLSFVFFIWWNRKTKKSIDKLIKFFERASEENIRIDINYVVFKEFKKMAIYINNMLEAKEKLQNELEKLAITDKLTGMNNRLKLDSLIESEILRCERFHRDISFAILDIDNFKKINDTFGHQVGDLVLVELAKVLKKNTRKVDFVGRWGGEEFLVVCPETNLNGAKILLENLRKTIESHKIKEVGNITISAGITVYKKGDSYESILKRADDALYIAKDTGRNKIVASN